MPYPSTNMGMERRLLCLMLPRARAKPGAIDPITHSQPYDDQSGD